MGDAIEMPVLAVGDLVEVRFSYVRPDGVTPEPGGPRRRYRGRVVQAEEPLLVEVTEPVDLAVPAGTQIAPYKQPGQVLVRRVGQQAAAGLPLLARSAPAHVVGMLIGAGPLRIDPHGGPVDGQARAWKAHLRAIADVIWAEAWHAGASYMMAHNLPAPVIVTTEDRYQRLADAMGMDVQRLMGIDRDPPRTVQYFNSLSTPSGPRFVINERAAYEPQRRLCSKGPCTRAGVTVLVFDARPGENGAIGIRAEAWACAQHREELAKTLGAHGQADAEELATIPADGLQLSRGGTPVEVRLADGTMTTDIPLSCTFTVVAGGPDGYELTGYVNGKWVFYSLFLDPREPITLKFGDSPRPESNRDLVVRAVEQQV